MVLTRLPNQQKEPHAPREIDQQGSRISRVPQQIHHREERPVHLGLEPASAHRVRVKGRMRGRMVVLRGFADEGRREAPSDPDQRETQNVVQGPWLGLGLCHSRLGGGLGIVSLVGASIGARDTAGK